jgi:hypothetical protein
MTRARRTARARTAATAGLLASALVCALACAGARSAARTPVERRAFDVPPSGALELGVPAGWSARAEGGDDAAPVTVKLADPGGTFVVFLIPIANPAGEGPEASTPADTAQLLTEMARRKALEGSVEKEIALEELVGKGGVHGYWFAATDRTLEGRRPEEGEYRHIVQGAAAVGELILTFRLLDNGAGTHRETVLEMIRTARHLPANGGADASRGFEPDPDAETVPLVVADPASRVTVLVDLPGFEVFKPRPGDDGKSLLVLGQSAESGIVASVILRDAPGQDATACRDDALARIRKAAPAMIDLRLDVHGGIARAFYAVDELHGRPLRQEHAHGFIARAGVCVNLHVSKAKPAPGDAERLEQIVASLRFGETL